MRIFPSLKVNLFVGVVAVVLLALLLAPTVAQAAAWSVVASPNATPGNNELHAVASISANDVWAVGTSENTLGNDQTLILHWDGTAWSIVASPTTGIVEGNLLGVAAVATNDVWAVGNASNASGVSQTLIEHWNGKQWSIVASPSPSTQTNFLLGVTAVSTNDVWAVGSFRNASGAFQTLTLHWDGTAWSIVASPSPDGAFNDLFGVAAVSTSDVWAVGDSGSGTLIEQWNGSSWSVVSSPNPGSGSSPGDSLRGAVADPSSGQAWAVGQFTAASGATQTLTEFNP